MDDLEKFIRDNKDNFDGSLPNKNLFDKINKSIKKEDALERFIKVNKVEFDEHTPSEKNWEAIRNQINTKEEVKLKTEGKVVSVNFVWRLAAAFLVILFTSVYFVWKVAPNYNNQPDNAQVSFEEISPELVEAELYYGQVINNHIISINSYATVDASIKEEFKKDIAELDSTYLIMKNDLLENTDNEYIVAKMIQNLQIRVELLSRQIMILENIKQQKNENANTHNL